MPKLKSAAQKLRRESLLMLSREAIWRASRQVRKLQFRALVHNMNCPVRYQATGYYRPIPGEMSPESKRAILAVAEAILRGEYPFLGYGYMKLGTAPAWNVDFISGKDWPRTKSEEIVVVRHDGSDVKVPWELSRLQFLPVLGKAFVLSGDEKFRESAKNLLSNWIEGNPAGMGVNWTIAMEAALRSLSVCFLLELLWPFRPSEQPWLDKVTLSLWQHHLYIESHNEFSHLIRSNHYLSNIVGLHFLSASLRGKGMESRCRHYARKIEHEILSQTYPDGGDYEASTGYHILVAQMFTTSLLLMKAQGMIPAPGFRNRLFAMYEWISGLAGWQGRLPHIGDCDDGRVELLSDDLEQMFMPVQEKHSLTIRGMLGVGERLLGNSCRGRADDAVWYGLKNAQGAERNEVADRAVKIFPNSGIAVLRQGRAEAIFCAIPNGIEGMGSHTHNDKLSFILRIGSHELFCDSGTRSYTRNYRERNRYRASAAHNVAVVDGLEQNSISSERRELFRIGNEAGVSRIESEVVGSALSVRASHSGYERINVRHCRCLSLVTDRLLVLEDEFAPTVERRFDIFFHVPSLWKIEVLQSRGREVICRFNGPHTVSMHCAAPIELELESEATEISRAYGVGLPAGRIRVRGCSGTPFKVVTRIIWQ